MAIPRGVFDPAAVPAGWWDETAQPAGWFDAQLLDGAAPAQEILPGLFENQQQFYGPIVTTAYGIAAPLLSNEQTFHAPTVTAGAVGLLPPLLENEQQFYQARVGQPQPYESSRLLPGGAVFQWPGDSKVYLLAGGQVLQPPAAELLAPLIASGNEFYEPMVSPGGVALLPGLLLNEQSFYTPTVALPQPYESSRLLPGGAVFQYRGDERTYLLPGGQVVQPPSGEGEEPPAPLAAGGVPWRDRGAWPIGQLDDRDLLEILPIVIGALNASRTH